MGRSIDAWVIIEISVSKFRFRFSFEFQIEERRERGGDSTTGHDPPKTNIERMKT